MASKLRVANVSDYTGSIVVQAVHLSFRLSEQHSSESDLLPASGFKLSLEVEDTMMHWHHPTMTIIFTGNGDTPTELVMSGTANLPSCEDVCVRMVCSVFVSVAASSVSRCHPIL